MSLFKILYGILRYTDFIAASDREKAMKLEKMRNIVNEMRRLLERL